MNNASYPVMVQKPQLSLVDRAVTFGSWVLTGALFLTVGWYAMEPDDPLGAVSVFSRHGGLVMLLQAAALAGVAGALATVLAGRRLADVGTFAVALGLGLVSLRGATAAYLLMQGSDHSATFERGLALKFTVESVGWFAVVVVALCASALVMRWCYGAPHESATPQLNSPSTAAGVLAGFDIPRVSTWWLGAPGDRQTVPADGVKHTLLATGVGLVAIGLLSTGLSSRSIRHGQVCFVVATAVFTSSYVADRVVPVRSALWSILSVGLMAVMGYVWASLRPSALSLPPYIPSSHFMRILPIQFIAVGAAAAQAAFWYTIIPRAETGDPPQAGPDEARRSTQGKH